MRRWLTGFSGRWALGYSQFSLTYGYLSLGLGFVLSILPNNLFKILIEQSSDVRNQRLVSSRFSEMKYVQMLCERDGLETLSGTS